jgi:hypothetical protein
MFSLRFRSGCHRAARSRWGVIAEPARQGPIPPPSPPCAGDNPGSGAVEGARPASAYRIGASATRRCRLSDHEESERDDPPHGAEVDISYLDDVSGIVAPAHLEEPQTAAAATEREPEEGSKARGIRPETLRRPALITGVRR